MKTEKATKRATGQGSQGVSWLLELRISDCLAARKVPCSGLTQKCCAHFSPTCHISGKTCSTCVACATYCSLYADLSLVKVGTWCKNDRFVSSAVGHT